MSRPSVSIIVPVYNAAPYIVKCLHSLCEQDFKDIEIIVVDDGSTDHSADLAEKIIDKRIRVLRLQHKGVSATRNAGIDAALGDYIIFVDGDDWVEPIHVSTLLNGLESGTDCAMILMSIDRENESMISESALFNKIASLNNNKFYQLFQEHRLSSPCDKIYKTKLINCDEKLRFDTNITYAEDLIFNLNYFKKINSVTLISKATYHYVKHNVSGSTRFHNNTAYILSKITECAEILFGNMNDNTKKILISHYLWGLINLYHSNSELSKESRKKEIKHIVSQKYYCDCIPYISSLPIHRFLKAILKLKNPTIIEMAFRLKLRNHGKKTHPLH